MTGTKAELLVKLNEYAPLKPKFTAPRVGDRWQSSNLTFAKQLDSCTAAGPWTVFFIECTEVKLDTNEICGPRPTVRLDLKPLAIVITE